MLGDINIAEPGALVVLLDLGLLRHNRKDLPEGFQTHQIFLEHVS
jgi:acetyl-CoA carboxylase beta subunit